MSNILKLLGDPTMIARNGFRSAVVLLILVSPYTASAAQVQISYKEIKAKWDARQKALQTFQFAWTTSKFETAAYYTRNLQGNETADNLGDVTTEEKTKFVMDRTGRARYDTSGVRWSSEQGRMVPDSFQNVYDGGVRTKYFPEGGGVECPSLSMQKRGLRESMRYASLVPFFMVFSAGDTEIGVFNKEGLVEVIESTVVDERECVVIRQLPSGASIIETRVYADVERDYLPLRYEHYVDGVPTSQVHIKEFAEHPSVGWVPIRWSAVRSFDSKGQPRLAGSSTVDSYRINEEIEAGTFEVEPVVGTWVTNYVTDEMYILKEGGKKRHILKGEFNGTNYAELLATKSGEAGKKDLKPRGPASMWLLVINGLVVLILVVFVAKKFAMRSKPA